MNPENPDTTFPIVLERWKSREELRREYLDSLSPEELRQVDSSYYWYKYGLPAFEREQARKYDLNQPRVPAGNPDGGQWTSSGGGTGARLAAADKPRFGGGAALAIILEIPKQVIERNRSENGLWDLFGHKHGTVAFTTIDGTDIF